MSLDQLSLKRKERLNELKKIKNASDSNVTSLENGLSNDENLRINKDLGISDLPLSFRNYDPELRGPRMGFKNSSLWTEETVEFEAQRLKDNTDSNATKIPFNSNELDISGLKSNKINCDLKRELLKKNERLKKKTEYAISKLIREKLLSMKNTMEDSKIKSISDT
ncbi:hypothetical protein PNEG_01386 [Pneumocystis murina B123]|uniref:Uncharacterized protein n=1 Tax=Pneumocystis murina (strain B123) TaxID=1069680 RepID=M7NS51_PNEMU|nr:hypothetical protein PNEG_01386 [Pneumocystis murina B123]EMR10107.1 hypothetical protein PNEG_01386 [Pneumocystis murina B123]